MRAESKEMEAKVKLQRTGIVMKKAKVLTRPLYGQR
jgi:hypothetical protein